MRLALEAQRPKGGQTIRTVPRLPSNGVVPFATAVIIVLLGVVFEWRLHPITPRIHLGAEYFNIGRALADGRGFSDPFGEATGPTAWMPPLYPAFMAVVIGLVRSKNRAAQVISISMVVANVVQAITIHRVAAQSARSLSAAWASVCYLVWIGAFYYWFFLLTSDVWVLSLLVNFLLLELLHHVRTNEIRPRRWALLGGLSALTSPATAFAWASTSALFFFRSARDRRRLLYAMAGAACLAAPWVARNALVFGTFIPTKANLGFELYQANVVDSDGVYDISSMMAHPYNSAELRQEYLELGEQGFVARYRQRFLRAFAAEPRRYVTRVLHRAAAATVDYIPISPDMASPIELGIQRVVYALPFILLVFGLVAGGPHRPLLGTIGVFGLSYLAPYVAVAFYARYFFPLTPLLVVATFLSLDRIAFRVKNHRTKHDGFAAAARLP